MVGGSPSTRQLVPSQVMASDPSTVNGSGRAAPTAQAGEHRVGDARPVRRDRDPGRATGGVTGDPAAVVDADRGVLPRPEPRVREQHRGGGVPPVVARRREERRAGVGLVGDVRAGGRVVRLEPGRGCRRGRARRRWRRAGRRRRGRRARARPRPSRGPPRRSTRSGRPGRCRRPPCCPGRRWRRPSRGSPRRWRASPGGRRTGPGSSSTGPSATIVTGDGAASIDLGEEVLAERRELGPDDGRQDDAVHVVAARAPVLGERHSVGSGVVPAAGERDLGPAERDEDATQVPQPGAAVDEAGAVDGDRAHVHRGVAEEHVDREQVVHAHVGRDDDRARTSRRRPRRRARATA